MEVVRQTAAVRYVWLTPPLPSALIVYYPPGRASMEILHVFRNLAELTVEPASRDVVFALSSSKEKQRA
jgi:hypothetical protein